MSGKRERDIKQTNEKNERKKEEGEIEKERDQKVEK